MLILNMASIVTSIIISNFVLTSWFLLTNSSSPEALNALDSLFMLRYFTDNATISLNLQIDLFNQLLLELKAEIFPLTESKFIEWQDIYHQIDLSELSRVNLANLRGVSHYYLDMTLKFDPRLVQSGVLEDIDAYNILRIELKDLHSELSHYLKFHY